MTTTVVLSLALIGVIVYIFYYYFLRKLNHWKHRGVSGPAPKIFYGNFKNAITQKNSYAYEIDQIYRAYKKTDDFIGIFNGSFPQLLILNPELVKKILITDFSSFSANQASEWTSLNIGLMLSDHPFVLTGQEWKDKRQELLPSLTPAKMKTYYPVIKSVCSKLTNHIKDYQKDYENCTNATELTLKFTAEVICDVVWGLEAGSFSSKEGSQFLRVSVDFVADFFNGLGVYLMGESFPILKLFQKAEFINKRSANYYKDLTKIAIEGRSKSKERNDILQFLLKLQEKKHLSNDQFVGRQLIFVFDGIDTTAVITSNVLLFIARERAVQSKLRALINEMVEEDGFLDCDTLQNMEYLENIVNETLRIFTPFSTGLAKFCTQPYELSGHGKTVNLKPNDVIILPTYSFHNDSEYYDEPEKFNPDRFSEENGGVKKFKDAGVFFPFGYGPRICLGMKIATTLVKSAVVELVRNFDIQVHPKTRTDNQCDPSSFVMKLDGGVHLKLKSL